MQEIIQATTMKPSLMVILGRILIIAILILAIIGCIALSIFLVKKIIKMLTRDDRA